MNPPYPHASLPQLLAWRRSLDRPLLFERARLFAQACLALLGLAFSVIAVGAALAWAGHSLPAQSALGIALGPPALRAMAKLTAPVLNAYETLSAAPGIVETLARSLDAAIAGRSSEAASLAERASLSERAAAGGPGSTGALRL